MSTAIDNAVAVLLASQQVMAGITVKYGRGTVDTELTAVPGQSLHELQLTGTEAIGIRSRDWLINPVDLKLNGEQIEPLRGDTIKYDDHVYEVVHRGESESFRFTDQTRQMMRVFTQEV